MSRGRACISNHGLEPKDAGSNTNEEVNRICRARLAKPVLIQHVSSCVGMEAAARLLPAGVTSGPHG
jgi:hypothetical protein